MAALQPRSTPVLDRKSPMLSKHVPVQIFDAESTLPTNANLVCRVLAGKLATGTVGGTDEHYIRLEVSIDILEFELLCHFHRSQLSSLFAFSPVSFHSSLMTKTRISFIIWMSGNEHSVHSKKIKIYQ
jgi:hypothetical protein